MNFGQDPVFSSVEEQELRGEIAAIEELLITVQENIDNMYDACCTLEILKERAGFDNKFCDQGFRSIADAIDSNNPDLFMDYIYKDHSDGRQGHISVIPKFDNLFYAIRLNPDKEALRLNNCPDRNAYIANLCAIIDSIIVLASNNGQISELISGSSGDNIIHMAVVYSCPEILKYLLNKLSQELSMKAFNQMINAKNNKKDKKSPLELALMIASEEKVALLIYHGADMTLLSPEKLNFKFVPQEKKLIRLIIENKHELRNLKHILGVDQTKGLRAENIWCLLENYKIEQKILKKEREIALQNAKIERKLRKKEFRLAYEMAEEKRRVRFESAKLRNKIAFMLSSIGVAALVAYKLFSSEKIVATKTLTFFR